MDIDLMISLIEARSVLWDKTSHMYKDRNETKKAWKEVCTELNNDFSNYDNEKKNEYGKEVVKRWVNIRDAFNKSIKKEKSLNKFASGASIIKKYVYAKQLKFLTKIFCPRSTENSLSTISNNEDTESTVLHNDNENDSDQFKVPPRKLGSRKRKIADVEMRMLKALEEPDRHISFFKGIVPTLHTFTEDETIKFQMGVLQLVSNIKQSRFRTQQRHTDFNSFSPAVAPTVNYNRYIPTQKIMRHCSDLELSMNQPGISMRYQTTENRPKQTHVREYVQQFNHVYENPSSVDSNNSNDTDESVYTDLDFT